MKTALLSSFFLMFGSLFGQWSEVGNSGNNLNANSTINTIALDVSGNLYAGGSFKNSSNSYYVAKWNGSSWGELGGNNSLNANNVINSICLDYTGAVCVSGKFTNPSGKFQLMKYNGVNWNQLGGGISISSVTSDYVYVSRTDKLGNIYYTGNLKGTMPTGGLFYGIYKWNGVSLTHLPPVNNNNSHTIYGMCMDTNNHVHRHYNGGGTNLCSVLKWNGTQWDTIGGSSGLNTSASIYYLHCDHNNNHIYAAMGGTGSPPYIAKWNGSNWTSLGSLGSSLTNTDLILTICTDNSGNVYAAGSFKNSSGKNYVAKWNGSSWTELGGVNGLNANGTIYSIASYSGCIYAAGAFKNSTNKYYVAKYCSCNYTLTEKDTTICEKNLPFTWYGKRFTKSYRQDTIVRKNQSGCDSIISLSIAYNPFIIDTLTKIICAKDSYLFKNKYRKTSGYYIDSSHIFNGCEGIRVLNLIVKNSIIDSQYKSIFSFDSLLFKSKYIRLAGIYHDTLKTKIGCDSIVVLNLKLKELYIDTLSKLICKGDSFLFKNKYLKNAGLYIDSLKSIKGFDSLIILKLNYHNTYNDTIVKSICTGDSFWFNSRFLKITGYYSDNLKSTNNCDSIVTLNLNVFSSIIKTVNATTCSNIPYYFNGKLLTSEGTFYDTFTSKSGCDSLVKLNLSFNSIDKTIIQKKICYGSSYFFKGTNIGNSGIYYDTLSNSKGCDSIIALQLYVKPLFSQNLYKTICHNMTYNGYNSSGIYTEKYVDSDGCDSTIQLTLNILNPPLNLFDTVLACNPFFYKGKNYTDNLTIIDSIRSQEKCDSVFLNRFVKLKSPAKSLQVRYDTICDSIRIKNTLYTSSFSYSDTIKTNIPPICDSLYQPYSYTIYHTPNLILSVKEIDTFYKGNMVSIKASPAKYYLWNTGESNSQIQFKITENIDINVTGWNNVKCSAKIGALLIALDPTIVDIPNAFAPYGIIENRFFRPNINGRIEKIQFDIYNRLGEKVYSSNSITLQGWDGTFKNIECPTGLYSYILEYETNRRLYLKTGEVMLVR